MSSAEQETEAKASGAPSVRKRAAKADPSDRAQADEPPLTTTTSATAAATPASPGQVHAPVVGRVYVALVLLRAMLCLLPLSYLHPDEYHQNQEVTAGDVWGCATVRPWEFQRAFPVRSALFP